jgi:hypothetical protein
MFLILFVIFITSLVWLKAAGVVLFAILHLAALFVCLKKRNQRNTIKKQMKIKEMMFSEILVESGMERRKAYERPKTLHI